MKSILACGIAIALAAAALAPGEAAAATSTTTFDVTLDFENTCRVAVTDIPFGLHDHLLDPISAIGEGTVACSGIIPVTVTFDVGTVTGSTFASRLMKHATLPDTIAYNLYSDVAHTSVLGDGVTGGTVSIPLTGSDTFEVYAQTFVTSAPKTIGLYSSTITATITF
jgi:spore coat protein U-like protein